MSDFPIASASGSAFMNELPDLYEPVYEMRIIVQAEGEQFDRLTADAADRRNQRFAGTATWDLPNWEEELGIVPPAGQPLEQRRSVVRSKMRGFGKFTGELVKSIAEAYDYGEVVLAFIANEGKISVTFVSMHGTPPNINDIQNAILAILPAHLVVSFIYTYLTWNELDAENLTWDELDQFEMTWDEFEKWRP